jgi:hypothetical protein
MPSVGGKKNFQNFTVMCRKPHVASSICLRATVFQNPEGTLWTLCISLNNLKFVERRKSFFFSHVKYSFFAHFTPLRLCCPQRRHHHLSPATKPLLIGFCFLNTQVGE